MALYDDIFSPYRSQPLPGQYPTQPGRSPIQPLPQDEYEGLLSQVTGKALGGLGWVGESLAKPGRAVRGLLAGRPEELANLIPFSDTMGITDPSKQVTGRNLLENIGLVDKGVPGSGLDVGDVAGFGADILTDPLSYLAPGASTAAGKTLAKIGVKAPTFRQAVTKGVSAAEIPAHAAEAATQLGMNTAPLLNQPTRSLVGLHAPFPIYPFATGSDAVLNLGTGKTAETILDAAGTVGNLASKIPVVGPMGKAVGVGLGKAGRNLGALLDSTRENAMSPLGVESAQAMQPEIRHGQAKASLEIYDVVRQAQQAGLLTNPEDIKNARRLMEGVITPAQVHPDLVAVVDRMRQMKDPRLAERMAAGAPGGVLGDEFVQHAPRFRDTTLENMGKGQVQRVLDPASGVGNREDIWRNFPGGTEGHLPGTPGGAPGLNAITVDPEMRTLPRLAAADKARKVYLQMSPEEFALLNDSAPRPAIPPGQGPLNRAELLAHPQGQQWVGSKINDAQLPNAVDYLDPQKVQQMVASSPNAQATRAIVANEAEAQRRLGTLIGRSTERFQHGEDLARHVPTLKNVDAQGQLTPLFGNSLYEDMATHLHASEVSKAHANSAADLLVKGVNQAGVTTAGGVKPLETVIKNLEAQGIVGSDITGPGGISGFRANLAKRLNISPTAMAVGAPAHLMVPAEIEADLLRRSKGFQFPEALQNVLNTVDKYFTNPFRSYNLLSPAYHVRNLVSGQVNSLGENLMGNPLLGRTFAEGGTIPGAATAGRFPILGAGQGTDQAATQELMDLYHAYGGKRFNQTAEAVAQGQRPGPRALSMLPEENLSTWKGIGKTALGKDAGATWNPFEMGTFGPAQANLAIGGKVEDVNRMAPWLELVKQGWSPQAAMDKVTQMHYGYQYTPFERQVMRRIMPYYGFAKENIPYQAQRLLQEPGGLSGQLLHASNALRQREGFVPDYLSNTLSIPVGKEDETGNRRYLTGLGLAPEQALEMFRPDVSGTIGRVLSQMNPLIKYPIETATGKQLYSGRDLSSLYSPLPSELPAWLANLPMNVPGARQLGMVTTALDPRKGPAAVALNELTGAKVSDVNVAKLRAMAAREYINEQLRDNPLVRQMAVDYVPKELVAQLPPNVLQFLRMERSMQEAARKEGQQRPRVGAMRQPA